MPDSVRAAVHETIVQTGVIHLIRQTFRYYSKKCWQQISGGLRRIFGAPSREAAWAALDEMEEKWGKTYPGISAL